jgi:acyl carrier protein
MNTEEIRTTILRVLGEIAPEVDAQSIEPDVNLREQLDLDSMDFLNFLIALDKEVKVEIPERDYGKLATLNALVDYLAARLPKGS